MILDLSSGLESSIQGGCRENDYPVGGNSSAGRHIFRLSLQTNQFSTNQSGFNARGSVSRFAGGGHSSFKTDAYYWCADVNNDTMQPVKWA